jgi:hypothetical protein
MTADVFKTAASLRCTPGGCNPRVCVSRLRIDACGQHRHARSRFDGRRLYWKWPYRGTLGGLTQFALFSPESRP